MFSVNILKRAKKGLSRESRASRPCRPVLIDAQQSGVKWGGALHSADQIAESKGRQNEMGRV